MKKPTQLTSASVISKELAETQVKGLQSIVEQSKNEVKTTLMIDELAVDNKAQSELITLSLLNTATDSGGAGKDVNIVLGTPLGVDSERDLVPYVVPNSYLDELANISDNQGAGAKFLQLINKRLLRHPALISSIEIITPNNASGQAQRTESLKHIIVPYNSANDTNSFTGAFVPQFTEYTASELLNKPLVIGEFRGLIYKLKYNVQVNINIRLASVDVPNFKV